jgi:hypothetical protein
VHRDAVQPLAQVRAAPLAHIDTDTELMLVWFREDHPAAPKNPVAVSAKPDAVGELKSGNAAIRPQTATHAPAAAAPAAGTTPPPAPASAQPRPPTPVPAPAQGPQP